MKCPTCHGTGERWVYYDDPDNISGDDELVRCETCDGTGRVGKNADD